ncbi:DUF5071 domain-containing protein [Paenibacillus thiaminolyticus]|uniref:DUF5071 domain-containing protein n=1 Tax=Paenibacillus thiaminolyticus TaxID=49283 RepID=A0AAP9J3L1_PANTH|nr:DUF5071 domain-containing protein [Paenibacillus thiaminolyticus]
MRNANKARVPVNDIRLAEGGAVEAPFCYCSQDEDRWGSTEWTQDINWPIAQGIIDILLPLDKLLVPAVKEVAHSIPC